VGKYFRKKGGKTESVSAHNKTVNVKHNISEEQKRKYFEKQSKQLQPKALGVLRSLGIFSETQKVKNISTNSIGSITVDLGGKGWLIVPKHKIDEQYELSASDYGYDINDPSLREMTKEEFISPMGDMADIYTTSNLVVIGLW